jgi:hypothetical protein
MSQASLPIIHDLTPEVLDLIGRLIVLMQIPQQSWTEEDIAFYRRVREIVQEARKEQQDDHHDCRSGSGPKAPSPPADAADPATEPV